MCHRIRLVFSLIVLTSASCRPVSRATAPNPDTSSCEVRMDSSAIASVLARGIHDTQAEVTPTPLQITEQSIRLFQRTLRRFQCERGRAPRDLQELLTLGPHPLWPSNDVLRPTRDWFVDGWGAELEYRLEGSVYTISSLGPDKMPGTPDDIVVKADLR
jgi:hypothetical protein